MEFHSLLGLDRNRLLGLHRIMSNEITYILALTDALGEHLNVTHWSVSMRISGKGDRIQRLKKGGDVNTKTAERLIAKLREIWPADLEWIDRPAKTKGIEA